MHRDSSSSTRPGSQRRWSGTTGVLLAVSALLAVCRTVTGKTLTLVAALRVDRMTAPYTIDGAIDGPSFLAYVEQVLAPTLYKGDTVRCRSAQMGKCLIFE